MSDERITQAENKMRERGFVTYANVCSAGVKTINFVSDHMYNMTEYEKKTPRNRRMAVINVIVNPETDEFYCVYNCLHSINFLKSPSCSPFTDDDLFNRIVSKFEIEATWLERMG